MGGGGSDRGRPHGRREPEVELFPKNPPSGIAPLGKAKFPDSSSKHLWFVVFYVNDSKDARTMKPTLEKLANNVRGKFKVGAVNCARSPTEIGFCKSNGVYHECTSYPDAEAVQL